MIEFQNVAFNYGDRSIFNNVTLQIAPGSFHFITGPSGAGKTTLLRMCYQEAMPQSGVIRIFGQDVRAMTRDDVALMRRRIGLVHQDCQFIDHLPLYDNLLLPREVADQSGEDDYHNLRELARWVGIDHVLDALPPSLSGGERQRAALARAVMLSPQMLIADEPTGNLDPKMSERLLELMIGLNKMGTTILIATHDMTMIRQARTRVDADILRIQNQSVQSSAGAGL